MNGAAKREAELLREYVQAGRLMQLATVSTEGLPWLAHCWYAADSDLKLIFLSRQDRRHSYDIINNGKVAGGIIGIQLEGLGQKVRGVIFEGMAAMVPKDELGSAYAVYSRRWPKVKEMVTLDAIANDQTSNRLWCVRPAGFVLFDEVSFPEEPRRELSEW
jgi:uncharacterized protein YhbP (UPF0306 family)